MKININCVPDYENLEIIHKNALPARAYFIPAKNLSEYPHCRQQRHYHAGMERRI